MEKMMDTMRPLYEKAVAEAKAADTPEKRRGVGIAWGGFNVTEGTTDSAEVALELGADGRIWKYDTWHNMGQGGDVGSLMVTLEALEGTAYHSGRCTAGSELIPSSARGILVCRSSAAVPSIWMATQSKIAAEKLLNNMRKPDGHLPHLRGDEGRGHRESKVIGRYKRRPRRPV